MNGSVGESWIYRSARLEDRRELQDLHIELFPIKYNDSFYDELVQGIGMHGGRLHSIIAEDPASQRIAGFAIVQFLRYFDQVEDREIFAQPLPKYACYILTLGVSPQFRRRGLASILLSKCKSYAASNPQCGALYLHVIDYNTAAIELYSKNQFQSIRTLPDFYYIDNKGYTAILYILYMNNHHFPDGRNSTENSLFSSISDWTSRGWEALSERMTQWLFDSSATVASATHWVFEQFSPELMAVSVAQISHHWMPTTAALLPGTPINIEVHSSEPSSLSNSERRNDPIASDTAKNNFSSQSISELEPSDSNV